LVAPQVVGAVCSAPATKPQRRGELAIAAFSAASQHPFAK
jgi:hypothetical protein